MKFEPANENFESIKLEDLPPPPSRQIPESTLFSQYVEDKVKPHSEFCQKKMLKLFAVGLAMLLAIVVFALVPSKSKTEKKSEKPSFGFGAMAEK